MSPLSRFGKLVFLVAALAFLNLAGAEPAFADSCYDSRCPGEPNNCTYWMEDFSFCEGPSYEMLWYTDVYACTQSSDVFYEYSGLCCRDDNHFPYCPGNPWPQCCS
jgi:hypothetical protein